MAQLKSDTEEIKALYLYAKQRKKRKRHVSVHEILQRSSESSVLSIILSILRSGVHVSISYVCETLIG